MICIQTDIPKEICDLDDELKAIYHSKNSICIWLFNDRRSRNKFMYETIVMLKEQRDKHYLKYYS